MHTLIELTRLIFDDPLTDDDEIDLIEDAGVDFWGEQRTIALNKSRNCQSSICTIQFATLLEQTPTQTLLKLHHVANKAPQALFYHNNKWSSYLMPWTSDTSWTYL